MGPKLHRFSIRDLLSATNAGPAHGATKCWEADRAEVAPSIARERDYPDVEGGRLAIDVHWDRAPILPIAYRSAGGQRDSGRTAAKPACQKPSASRVQLPMLLKQHSK
jgi:hypothetical protein